MLLNNLDAAVAERPEDLVVYGGSGRAARSHDALKAIVRALLELGDDETLLVQSGKPVAVFRTTRQSPRVLIANSLLVPKWATWDEFRRLEAEGLTMFGQMTAAHGSISGRRGSCRAPTRPSPPQRSCISASRRSPDAPSSRRGSAAWAARSRSRPRSPAGRSSASRSIRRASSGVSRRATSTRPPSRWMSRSHASGQPQPKAEHSRWGCSATPRTSCRSSRGAASTSTSSRTRPRRTIR